MPLQASVVRTLLTDEEVALGLPEEDVGLLAEDGAYLLAEDGTPLRQE